MHFILTNRVNDYKALLKKSPELIAQQDQRGKTALHYAITMLSSAHHALASKFLKYALKQPELKKFLPLSLADNQGNLPIHLIAKQLKGLEIQRRGQSPKQSPETPYQAALIIARLIANRKDNHLCSQNQQGQIPLDFLNESKDPATFEALLPLDFDLDAAFKAELTRTRSFLLQPLSHFSEKRDIKAQLVNRFYESLSQVAPSKLDATIRSRMDLLNTQNKRGDGLITLAIQKNNWNLFTSLLRNKAEVNNQSSTSNALIEAVRQDNLNMVAALINAGADVNKATDNKFGGYIPLHEAILKENLEIVKALIKGGARLNTPDQWGKTALEVAIQKDLWPEQLNMIKTLIDAGADVNSRGIPGTTPLYEAASYLSLEIVQALLAAGADVNMPTRWGQTPLYGAVNSGRLEIVNALIAAGADVNQIDRRNGDTPLITAMYKDDLAIFNALIQAEADLNAPDAFGETPLQRARRSENSNLVEILLHSGASTK
jgi:ankyrin repeat protein